MKRRLLCNGVQKLSAGTVNTCHIWDKIWLSCDLVFKESKITSKQGLLPPNEEYSLSSEICIKKSIMLVQTSTEALQTALNLFTHQCQTHRTLGCNWLYNWKSWLSVLNWHQDDFVQKNMVMDPFFFFFVIEKATTSTVNKLFSNVEICYISLSLEFFWICHPLQLMLK